MDWWLGLRTELKAASILIRRLGGRRAFELGRRVRQRKARGEPFGELPPPDCTEERSSREQIGPAILLYRELLGIVEQKEAYEMAREVIVAAAILFLRRSIGRIDRRDLEALDDPAREAFIKERGAKFFNATTRWERIGPDDVHFVVTACRFPPLCEAVGVPELAPAFCQGDAAFFEQWGVTLTRPHTIAEGGQTCPFTLRWSGG